MGLGMEIHKIAMGPDRFVLGEVGIEITRVWAWRLSKVVPEEYGHIWEGSWSDKFTCFAIWDGRSLATEDGTVVNCDGRSQRWALGTADINGGKGVFLSKASSLNEWLVQDFIEKAKEAYQVCSA